MNFYDIQLIIVSLALIAGGFLIGVIFEKIILNRIKVITGKTKWQGDEIVVNSLRGVTVFWFLLAGIYGSVLYVPMDQRISIFLYKVLLVLAILSATFFAARVSVGFVKLYAKKAEGVLPTTSIFTNLTKILIYVVGVLIVFQSLGIPITPILTALGVGGLAVALALQDTLSNLFSGLHIIIATQLKLGDYVRLETGEEGYVEDITWRNTTIRALPNNIIVVPNDKLASTIVTNYYEPETEIKVFIDVGVSYDSNLEYVEEVTIDVAKEVMAEVEGGIPEYTPLIRYHTFGDSSINFVAILRAKKFVDQYRIKHEFIKKLHKRYKAEGIEIPFPIRTVYMHK